MVLGNVRHVFLFLFVPIDDHNQVDQQDQKAREQDDQGSKQELFGSGINGQRHVGRVLIPVWHLARSKAPALRLVRNGNGWCMCIVDAVHCKPRQ